MSGLARRAKRILQKRDRARRELRAEGIAEGRIAGPLANIHNSGQPHPWRKCPYCVIEINHALNSRPLRPLGTDKYGRFPS